MVVVLGVLARRPTDTEAVAVQEHDGECAANMTEIVKDATLAPSYSALTTASPICAVPTRVVPGLWMSGVRSPSASTFCTAASMR